MRARCRNPKHPAYDSYGGRGITVCKEWDDFLRFWGYMRSLPRPTPEHNTLDRTDNDGNYEPGNVRWATASQQQLNRRLNRNNKSGYLGVSWDSKHGMWQATRFINRKVVSYGFYDDPAKAAEARQKSFEYQGWRENQ